MKIACSILGWALVAVAMLAHARTNGPENASKAIRKAGSVRTIALPGGATMEMIWCPPGKFTMGSPVDEPGRFEDEKLHSVEISHGFWLGKYEVTQRQWESVMRTNNSRFRNPDNPVENVSWHDCETFIRRVNTEMEVSTRLPTEAEWEYACRAGSGDPVSGGDPIGKVAWYDKNSSSQTHAVGQNKPNAWGFYDMHGNVLEWCADWFSVPTSDMVDPQGPPSGSFKILRGGCWFFYERDCRAAYRLRREPSLRNCIFGFRLACSDD